MRDREQKWHVYDYYVLLIKQVRCKSLVGTCLPNMKNPTRLSLLCDFCGRLVEARCLKVAGNGESPEDVQSRISGESSRRGRRGPQPKQRYRANTPGRGRLSASARFHKWLLLAQTKYCHPMRIFRKNCELLFCWGCGQIYAWRW